MTWRRLAAGMSAWGWVLVLAVRIGVHGAGSRPGGGHYLGFVRGLWPGTPGAAGLWRPLCGCQGGLPGGGLASGLLAAGAGADGLEHVVHGGP